MNVAAGVPLLGWQCVSKWKQYRAVVSRYDKRDYIFHGTLAVAAIVIWLRDIVQEPSGRA
ncbi:hypothetical protein [Streptomyces sp. NPDC001135]